MLFRFNRILEKLMPVITPTSVVLGVILTAFLARFTYLVPWIFAFMTFSGSLNSNFSDLKRAVFHPKRILICLAILHIIMPLIALGVGHLFFPGDNYTITGIVLAFVIPTGIMSLIWVSIYKGNIALTLSIILLNTMLSPLIITYSLKILVGSAVEIDQWGMMSGLFWMIVVPSLAGMILNQVTKGSVKTTVSPKLAPFTKIGLGVVVAINSAAVAPFLADVSWKLVGIIVTVFLLAFCGYVIGGLVAKYVFHWNYEDVVALTFNSGMRNISAGAVIAITFFAPPVAIPVISCMLIQQLLASFFGHMLHRFAPKETELKAAQTG
ncbi:bile acid:sodium symporter family protein [Anaerobacillus sp. CMMVII]|uniref:bile acid:sodium symporter family protein n=1 Tax=Anaerobacillus sp. CMMVII TaxID=2755588 RepID=UPI0021B7E937|nr:bile acid:sodium symporter family protein [Anaerobacillus sp. CMMVII]MCT8138463.1 bile acid:sodium symporter family protein [Anaerobacillus sp. CMMVII]